MTGSTRHRVLSISRNTFLFWAAACLPQLPAAGQTNDVAAAKEALSQLAQFSNDVSKMHKVVTQPLAPFMASYIWCLGLDGKNETIQAIVDYNNTIGKLDSELRKAEQGASLFSKSYEPIQTWLDGLTKFSAKFDVTADRILGVQADIKAGRGPSDQQRQIVKQALRNLADDLSSSSAPLQSGTKALATALQLQSSYAASIKQAIVRAEQFAPELLTRYQAAIQSPHCKFLRLEDQFNKNKQDFSRSIGEISPTFQKVEASSLRAQKGLAVLLGAVVNSQTELRSVLEQVNAAKNDELGSFLERLHLTSAKRQWEDLAQAASSLSQSTN